MSGLTRARTRTEGVDAAVETVRQHARDLADPATTDRLVDAALVFEDVADPDPLTRERGQRAIGVVYNPERELGNYVPTDLPDRYDSFVHVEETTALHPLGTEIGNSDPPETYPWGV